MGWWASWVLSVLGVVGIWLTGKKHWHGFAVGIVNEIAWVAYAIKTHQIGFIFGSTIYIAVYSLNINKWLSEAKRSKIKNLFHINPLNMMKESK